MRGAVLEGRYRLVQRLGAGGMGEVWRGVDTRLDREVAVKVIAQGPHEDGQLAARFRKEARSAARLAHSRIVTVHDHGEAEADGHPLLFLVMELVQGRPMSAFSTTGEPAIDAVVEWGIQICEGLAAAHRAGVIHRDIKPANIMVCGEGELDVKICDFGIARLVEESGPGLTGTGATIGTPAYMSPEQARGDRSIDGRSDLYSLGCLLYELLSGAPPFEGAGWSVLAQHINRQPDPVRALRPDVPDDLDRLILHLLEKEPHQRPADAQEVIDRLIGVRYELGRPLPDALELSQAPTADATRAPESAPLRRTAPVTEQDSSRAAAVRTVPMTGRTSAWSGLLAAGCIYAQFSVLTSWSPFWISAVCVLAFVAVGLDAYIWAPPDSGVREGDAEELPIGMAMLCAVLTAGFLLFWPPSPWWTALLALVLVGPLLSLIAAALRRVVESVVRRAPWQSAVGTAAGLLNGVTLAGLLAAGRGATVFVALLAGMVTWLAVAVVVTFSLPSVEGPAAES
ncbi:serine/threonine-protein kinase [Streptomyces yerevanensis]|uniref:serine/threonine-protein kinase n=1 Tax=Streptomyces yerevanensis TaxID=66378 RepID=UPI0012FED1A2|nr:serine/threonine-protein kinase [Streptomyces yerevanensis]